MALLFQNDPFRDMDNAFDRFMSRSGAPWSPPMDAYRRGNDVWVHVDLPGIAVDTIDIGVERQVLTITAERSWASHESDKVYLAERRRGAVSRQVHLGDGLDVDAIEADYHDGVLTLRIPVAEKAQPKRIRINSAASTDAIEAQSTPSS